MRTNKACPHFEKNNEVVPSINVAMTEEEESAIKQQLIDEPEDQLVKVDGTKLQLSSKLFKVSLVFIIVNCEKKKQRG